MHSDEIELIIRSYYVHGKLFDIVRRLVIRLMVSFVLVMSYVVLLFPND